VVELVVTSPEAPALGQMIAELVRSNIASDPARAQLVHGVAGRINIKATDAESEIGMLFTGTSLRIGPALPSPDLEVICDSATLMELANVRLRFGRPDPMTPEGRAILVKMMHKQLVVRGMMGHPKLLTRLQKLFTVS
jgi:hypothetical protein